MVTGTITNTNMDDVKVVYITGSSGVGKSFSGDYLSIVHGYKHIDGDGPVKQSHRSHYYEEISTSFYQCVNECWPKNEDGPENLWQPYMSELVRETLEAAKHGSKKVVLTHATYRDAIRSYVIQELVKGGIQQNNIKVIRLTIDPNIQRDTIYKRNKKLAKAGLPTLEDNMRAMGWNIEGLLPKKAFKKFYAKYLEVPYEVHDPSNSDGITVNTIVVDVSERDVTHFEQLDKVIELRTKGCTQTNFEMFGTKHFGIDADNISNMQSMRTLKTASSIGFTYECVCKEIKQITAKRDLEYSSTSLIDPLALTTTNTTTKKKPTLADYYAKRDEQEKANG